MFFNNYNDALFKKTKKSLNMFFILPGLTVAGFNLISPFSIFKGIGIYGVLFGTMGSLLFQFQTELDFIARKNKTDLGDEVRYRF